MSFFSAPTLSSPVLATVSQVTVDGRGGDVLISNIRFDHQVTVQNARHVVVSASQVALPKGSASGGAAITFRYIKGVVHIEGARIDCALNPVDCGRIYGSPGATVQLKNCWFERPGSASGDIWHNQGDGPIAEFLVDGLEGWTGGKGIFTPVQPAYTAGAKRVVIANAIFGWHPDATVKRTTLIVVGRGSTGSEQAPPLGASIENVGFDMTATQNSAGETFESRVAEVGDYEGSIADWTGRGQGYMLGDKALIGLGYTADYARPDPSTPPPPPPPNPDNVFLTADGLPGREGQVLTLSGDGRIIWADSPVISVFGRDGEVEPKPGDYQ